MTERVFLLLQRLAPILALRIMYVDWYSYRPESRCVCILKMIVQPLPPASFIRVPIIKAAMSMLACVSFAPHARSVRFSSQYASEPKRSRLQHRSVAQYSIVRVRFPSLSHATMRSAGSMYHMATSSKTWTVELTHLGPTSGVLTVRGIVVHISSRRLSSAVRPADFLPRGIRRSFRTGRLAIASLGLDRCGTIITSEKPDRYDRLVE